jgi:hypothetical protein
MPSGGFLFFTLPSAPPACNASTATRLKASTTSSRINAAPINAASYSRIDIISP